MTFRMDLASWLEPNAAGLTLAAAAVIGGAPLFGDGLRALRLRRSLRRVRASAPGAVTDGAFAQLAGRVALESPLFAPLSSVPCAGYDLEVHAVGAPLSRTIAERRAFRIADRDDPVTVVAAPVGYWDVAVTAERRLAAADPVSEGLAALLGRVPEALWWRRVGGTLRVVERALAADALCHVVGMAHVRRALVGATGEFGWARTGTDDTPVASIAVPAPDDVTIGAGDHLGFMLVSDQEPRRERLDVPLASAAGAVLGPLLSLLGMLYLVSAADHFRSLGRF
jgi:hypothetical protein